MHYLQIIKEHIYRTFIAAVNINIPISRYLYTLHTGIIVVVFYYSTTAYHTKASANTTEIDNAIQNYWYIGWILVMVDENYKNVRRRHSHTPREKLNFR